MGFKVVGMGGWVCGWGDVEDVPWFGCFESLEEVVEGAAELFVM